MSGPSSQTAIANRVGRISAVACPAFVFVASLIVYVRTMPPSIAVVGYAADVLKFQYVGKVLGTPHFGYPTYMLLNILVSRLPFFNLAYRLNLLSAVLASCTLVLLYFIVLRLGRGRLVATACALLFGFAYTFWENSIIAGVYSLNTVFMCGVLLLMLHWEETKKPSSFYLGCLVYAISFGNHLIVITLLPALVYWTFAGDRTILLKKKTYIIVPLCILLGLSQYGYVLVRSYQHAPQKRVFKQWPYTEDFGRTHMEVNERSILGVLNRATGGSEGRSHTTGMKWKARLGEDSSRESPSKKFAVLWRLLVKQFSPFGMFLGLTGLGFAFTRRRKRAVFLLLIILSHLGFIMTWGIPVNDVHIIPTCLVLVLFIAHNDNLLMVPPFSRRPRLQWAGQIFFVMMIASLAVFLVSSRFRRIDQSTNVWLANMTDTVLSDIPDDSLVFTSHIYAMAFWYKLYGEGLRPDAHLTFFPVWTVSEEDLDYGLKSYRDVFYFPSDAFGPILERMGIDTQPVTFSRYNWREYLSRYEPGAIVALYAEVTDRSSAQNVADALHIPIPPLGGLAVLGCIGRDGNLRIVALKYGELRLLKGVEMNGTTLSADVSIFPGMDIRVNGLSCSRQRKTNNLVVLAPDGEKIYDEVYVDWKHSPLINPAHFLRVSSRQELQKLN